MMTRVKQIRQRALASQSEAAAMADVSPTTWRIYEAATEAVTGERRQRCDAAVARLEQLIVERRKVA